MSIDEPKRPTLAKVALLANVSTATASNVLAGKGRASAETVARVQDAAQRIGYRTNAGARALSMGRTLTIGVLVSSEVDVMIGQRQSFFWMRLFDAFIVRCSQQQVTTSIVDELQAQALIDSGVDALVLLGRHDPEAVASLALPFGLPVLSATSTGVVQANFPTHDVALIANQVLLEFMDIGRRKIAWMPGPSAPLMSQWRSELESACREHGGEFLELDHDDSLGSLTAAFASDSGRRVDAVFGLFRNPRSLIDALHAAGHTVPSDVAVIVQSEGILEEVTTPTLTTLSLCGADCGDRLAEQAIQLARGHMPSVTAVPFELTRREST